MSRGREDGARLGGGGGEQGSGGGRGTGGGRQGQLLDALQVGVEELSPVSSESLWEASAHTPFRGPLPLHRATFFCLVHFGIGLSAAFVAAFDPECTVLGRLRL